MQYFEFCINLSYLNNRLNANNHDEVHQKKYKISKILLIFL
ncbi:hypothetical protein SAMN05216297_10555 [Flavobacterium phragmitis]|uniref:Uncharacterized protein n=1 Tax=Flavobacterium phragmitis TaxID=739143 RepID=A0A1I1Q9J2_9FLAO|nr:hypothetical protein SAMN05216297_10555 [Flavobacterium phragmitis]